MVDRRFFSFLLIVLLSQNAFGQILPIGGGCGCQQLPMPLQQNLALPSFIANSCGCQNSLLGNLPNGIQISNNLQMAKSIPCGCASNSLQLANLQNLQLANINGLQLTNGLQLANLANQDLLSLANAMPMPTCQNALQLSLQALLSQLRQQPCQCGCQSVAPLGNGIINPNLNLLGANGVSKVIANLPTQCGSLQVVTGQQEVVLGNSPCQSYQNIVTNSCPCQSCQNVVTNSCPCPSCQNVVSNACPCQTGQNIISNAGPCPSGQNIVTNSCSCPTCQNVVSNSCQNIVSNSCQNVVNSQCPCSSCQNPIQFSIYQ